MRLKRGGAPGRRGLRRLADETLGEARPGSSLRYLVATATADEFPPDMAERADHYLHGGGYQEESERARKKRARPG